MVYLTTEPEPVRAEYRRRDPSSHHRPMKLRLHRIAALREAIPPRTNPAQTEQPTIGHSPLKP